MAQKRNNSRPQKLLTLNPLSYNEAVSSLLKVKPESKAGPKRRPQKSKAK